LPNQKPPRNKTVSDVEPRGIEPLDPNVNYGFRTMRWPLEAPQIILYQNCTKTKAREINLGLKGSDRIRSWHY